MTSPQSTPVIEYPALPAASTELSGLALGIDIGGTGIKAAVVDLASGQLVTERIRELTPHPATVTALLEVVVEVIGRLADTGKLTDGMPVGVAFPSVIRAGRALTATNLDTSWVGANVEESFGQRLGRDVVVINDADAAGIAESAYGAAKGKDGVVLLLDLGTGIGSAVSYDGRAVPNFQLGQAEFNGHAAESRLSPSARKRRKTSWPKWGHDFNLLLAAYESYVWPDLMIMGGGFAKHFPKFQKYLKTRAPLVPAALGNTAGIIGAARIGASRALATTSKGPWDDLPTEGRSPAD